MCLFPLVFDGIVNVNSCVIGVFLVFLEAIFLKDGIFLCYGRATLAACFPGGGFARGETQLLECEFAK